MRVAGLRTAVDDDLAIVGIGRAHTKAAAGYRFGTAALA